MSYRTRGVTVFNFKKKLPTTIKQAAARKVRLGKCCTHRKNADKQKKKKKTFSFLMMTLIPTSGKSSLPGFYR